MADYDLSVNFMGLTLKGPFLADSAGYALSPAGLKRLLKAGYPAVITKSATWEALPTWPRPWDKSPRPRCYWDEGMDGSEALINPGFKRMAEYIKEVKPIADKLGAHIIGSFSPRTPEEGAIMAREYEKAGASAVHMDLVCSTAAGFRGKQHPGKGYDHLGKWWSENAERAMSAMKAAKEAIDIPLLPKSFYAKWAKEDPKTIRTIEETTKIDGISIHTSRIPDTVWIDIYRGKVFTYPKNPPPEALVPLALGNTMALAHAASKPILSAGGITNVQDIIAMTMAGATVVGVCRAIYRNVKLADELNDGIEAYMASQAIESLDDIRGIALKHPAKGPMGLALEYEEQATPLEQYRSPLASTITQ
ncbi:MAG: beta/alpha barrel domain-containing protein [Nitrososphaerales archaeon]